MNEYEKQAEDFLKATGTTITHALSDKQTAPLWVKGEGYHGRKYDITISNARGSYSFPFWGSIADAELFKAIEDFQSFEAMKTSKDYQNDEIIKKAGVKLSDLRYPKTGKTEALAKIAPTNYDILACLSVGAGDTFEDFCANFGYDEDSRIAEKTFKAVQEQENNLRRLFDFSQLDALNNIN